MPTILSSPIRASIIATLLALTAACGSSSADESDRVDDDPPDNDVGGGDDFVVGDLDGVEDDLGSALTIEFDDGTPTVTALRNPELRCGADDTTNRIITTIEQFGQSTYLVVSDQPVATLGNNRGGPSTVTVWELDAAGADPEVLAGPWTGPGEVSQGGYGPIYWWIDIEATLDTGSGSADLLLEHVVDECSAEAPLDSGVFEPDALFGLSPSSG